VPAEQKRSVRLARQREPLVPRLVDLLRGAGALESAAKPVACLLPRVGPGDPLCAVLVAGELLQLLELCDCPGRVEPHAGDSTAAIQLW